MAAGGVSNYSDWRYSSNVTVNKLQNLAPVGELSTATSPGTMGYSIDVSARGDAVIAIPVQPAPGVNGLEPDITIGYSGARFLQRSNEVLPEDILGYGWRLGGFGEIRRCVVGKASSASIQLNANDYLCLNGETLRLAYGSYWAEGSRYRTSRYGSQLVELKKHPNGKIWFQVSTPDGRIEEYGRTLDSRLKVGSSTEFGWSLNKVTDAFGNTMEYSYQLDTDEGINYPLEILYGNGGDASITFDYAIRTDAQPQPLGPSGIPQKQLVLLQKINVSLDGNPLREYRLISEDEGTGNYRRLTDVQLCGYEQYWQGVDCLNPLKFEWATNTAVDVDTGIYQITDGLGKVTQFDLTPVSGSTSSALFSERPFGEGIAPADASPMSMESGKYRWVVTELRRSNGLASAWHKTRYAYQGTGFVSNNHRGFLGYYAQRVTDVQSGAVTYRQFRLDFPYFGKVARQYQYDGDYGAHTQVLSKQQFRYGEETLVTGDPNISTTVNYPVLLENLETLYEQNQILGYRYTNNDYSKAGYGTAGELINRLVRTQKTATGANAPATQGFWGEVKAASVSGVSRSQQSTTSFLNRVSGSWLIGFVDDKDVRHYKGDTTIAPDRVQTMTAVPYPGSNKPDSITRFPGDPELNLTVSYQYDGNGNLLSETTSGANIKTHVTTASGYASRDNRYPASISNPESHTVTMTYDPRFGKPTKVTDADGRSTDIFYDPFGREISRTNVDGVIFNTDYDFCPDVDAANCPATGVYRMRSSSAITPTADRYYDLLGRLVRQDAASFNGTTVSRREFTYDEQGRLYTETAPFFPGQYSPTTRYQYDDLRNRLKQVTRPDGSEQRITYSPLAAAGQVEQRIEEDVWKSNGTTLAETQVKLNLYNLAGDLVQTTDAVGGTNAEGYMDVPTDYTYYGDGLLHTVKINGDAATKSSFVYDNAGNRTSLSDPNLGTVTTSYDALGQPLTQTDNKGQIIEYVHDRLGRLRFQADADGVAEWTYDPANATGALANRYYREGAILANDASSGGDMVFSETYTYKSNSRNGVGQLDTISTSLTAGGLSKSYTHSYAYDGDGRLKQVTYPGGAGVHYDYNPRGYLEAITDGVDAFKTFNEVNAVGQVEEEVYGNGLITNRTYNPQSGRLETIDTGVNRWISGIQNNEYRWRSNGTLESRLVYSDELEILLRQEDFEYDSLNRLEAAHPRKGGIRTLSTQYDKLGNIKRKSSSHAGDTKVTGYGYGETTNAGPNAVSSVTIDGKLYSLSYDKNGAISFYDDKSSANDNNKWVVWNARQLPTEITAGPSKTAFTAQDKFRYGPNGQRYYRESSWRDKDTGEVKTEKAFIVGNYEDLYPANDPDYQKIEKTRFDGNIQQIRAIDHTGMIFDTWEYLHRDHLGSIEKITDERGKLLPGATGNMAFDPYGGRRKTDWSRELSKQELEELLSEVGLSTRRGFTGHEHLDRTGLIHMNGRIYDPALGRFLSPDPLVQAPTYSQSWNRYSYVFNSPLSLVDPSGYSSTPCDLSDPNCDPNNPYDNGGADYDLCAYVPALCQHQDPYEEYDELCSVFGLCDDLCLDLGSCNGGGGASSGSADIQKAREAAGRGAHNATQSWHPPMLLTELSSERPALGLTAIGALTVSGMYYNRTATHWRVPNTNFWQPLSPLNGTAAALSITNSRANFWNKAGLGGSVFGQSLSVYSYSTNMTQGNYDAAAWSAADFGVGALTFSSSTGVAIPIPLLYFSYRAGLFDNVGKRPIDWSRMP